MRSLDFSSLHALFTTLLSLALITLLGVGIRLVSQVTIQQRRERMNRQINERLRALMAAYKTLGGSFTGDLTVNPLHRRDLLRHPETPAPMTAAPPTPAASLPAAAAPPLDLSAGDSPGSDRARRIRDAVEAALSDIILLGTEEQVRLAVRAARQLTTGKLVDTQELVVSLRAFIREALDLEPIPADLEIPLQGPARPGPSGGRDKADKGEGRQGGGGGDGGGMGGGGGGGMGSGGLGLSSGSHAQARDEEEEDDPSSSHHV